MIINNANLEPANELKLKNEDFSKHCLESLNVRIAARVARHARNVPISYSQETRRNK